MVSAFGHGFVLALALILPLGPQNTFVLGQGATHRRYRSVVPVVVTAGLSDTLLIVAAVSGVSWVSGAAPVLQPALTAAGVVFLVWMGYKTWRAPVSESSGGDAAADWPLGRKVRYSLSVSLLNPHAVMDTVVVIGTGSARYVSGGDKWAYAAAAVLVSWLWFVLLSAGGRAIRGLGHRRRVVQWLNRSSAVLMWAAALRSLEQWVRAG